MPLPDNFQLSQAKLQDYVDCSRRFQLRHLLMHPWPALIVEPPEDAERHLERGRAFHLLAHQHTLGLDPRELEATIDDPVLLRWWRTFLDNPPPGLPQTLRRSEVVLTAPLDSFRLLAKLDLLAVEPGQRFVIADWKTSARVPARSTLARRLQTRVYRYLAVEAGAAFNDGQKPEPEMVEMVYWFAEEGGECQRFPYDAGQHAADGDYLAGLVEAIDAHAEEVWPLTPDERSCRFCNYRSLCDRGVVPGFLEDLDEDLGPEEVEIDLEQIAEIEF